MTIDHTGPGTIRGTRDVLDAHLRRRKAGELEADIRENYHPDVILLSAEGMHHGPDGVRALAGVLRRYLPRRRLPVPPGAHPGHGRNARLVGKLRR
ncbi:MAG: hypothetical protein SYR96_25915 [Actinomycetota bacterium]|nr:hypothetical protein [Actinomycetota bacterium]